MPAVAFFPQNMTPFIKNKPRNVFSMPAGAFSSPENDPFFRNDLPGGGGDDDGGDGYGDGDDGRISGPGQAPPHHTGVTYPDREPPLTPMLFPEHERAKIVIRGTLGSW